MKQLKENRKRLVELLPDIFKQIYEIVEIQRIADEYLDEANEKLKTVLDNEFIDTSNELLGRYEKIAGLNSDQEDTEERKKRIIAAVNIDGSCTKSWFKKQLDIRCGIDNYQIVENDEKSYVYIATDFDKYAQAVEFCNWLDKVMPMNVKVLHDNFHRLYKFYRVDYCGTKPYEGTLGSIANCRIVYFNKIVKSKYRVTESNDGHECGTVNGTGTSGSMQSASVKINREYKIKTLEAKRLNRNECEGTCGSIANCSIDASVDIRNVVQSVKYAGDESTTSMKNENKVFAIARTASRSVTVAHCGVNYCGQ